MNREVRKLTWFVWRHYPPAKDWGRTALRRWVAWNRANGFILTVRDRPTDGILGLAIVRPMMRAQCYTERLSDHFDNEGDTYFVDLAIARKPRFLVLQALGFAGLKRFGRRDYMAFQIRGDKIKIIRTAEHSAKMFRKREVCTT